jgi:tetratricopeptide (TPR) repeat protein
MNRLISLSKRPAFLAVALVVATAAWSWAGVPSVAADLASPDAIVSGVRVGFRRPKQNPSAVQLGYGDRDLITKVDGKPVQATYEVRDLEWSPSLRRTVSLTVVTTDGKEVQRPAPDSWDGLNLRGENLGWRRYAQFYGPDHGAAWDALVKKGLGGLERADFPQAAKDLNRAAQVGAHDALTSFVLGLCAQQPASRGDKPDWDLSRHYLDQAMIYFDTTSGKDMMTEALARLYLARCLKAQQQTSMTLAQLEKAYSLDRNNPDIVGDLVRAYADAKAEDRGLKTLDAFLGSYPDCESLMTLRVDTLHKMGLYDEYLKALEKRVKAYPQSQAYEREYLKEMEKRADWAGCIKYLDSSLLRAKSDGDKKRSWDLETQICRYAIKGETPRQAVMYAEDLAKTRGTPDDFAELGRVYTSVSEWGKAAEAFHKYEEQWGKGDSQKTNVARHRVTKELDTILPHLNRAQLMQYGFKDRADQLERVRQQRGTFYPWLVANAGSLKTLLLAIGIIGLVLLILFKFLGRSNV